MPKHMTNEPAGGRALGSKSGRAESDPPPSDSSTDTVDNGTRNPGATGTRHYDECTGQYRRDTGQ